MAISLYDVTVSGFLQTVEAAGGFLDKGLAYCADKKIDPAEIVETRLIGDMAPFRFQIISIAHHSLGAMEAAKSGVFSPPKDRPLDYSSLQRLIADTRAGLEKLNPAEVNALEGRDMAFQIGDHKIPFVVQDFLLTFSLPNLHFHATTAYDILRQKGAPIGKRDYLGRLRVKT